MKSGESLDIVQIGYRNRQIISVVSTLFKSESKIQHHIGCCNESYSFPARSSTIAYSVVVVFFRQFKVRLPLKKQFIVQ